jgi:hypothetical protein
MAIKKSNEINRGRKQFGTSWTAVKYPHRFHSEVMKKSKTFKKKKLARRDGSLGELWGGTSYPSIQ